MSGLDKAVELVLKWTAQRQKDRAEATALLEALIKDCNEAIQVWKGYLSSPGAAGDERSIVSWVGAPRAKELHEINLATKARLYALGQLVGPEVGRFIDLEDDVIEMAYRQLKPGETGPDAAKSAVQTLEARARQWRAMADRIRNIPPAPNKKPAKAAPAKKAGKKPAARKPTTKKPAKKAPKKK